MNPALTAPQFAGSCGSWSMVLLVEVASRSSPRVHNNISDSELCITPHLACLPAHLSTRVGGGFEWHP